MFLKITFKKNVALQPKTFNSAYKCFVFDDKNLDKKQMESQKKKKTNGKLSDKAERVDSHEIIESVAIDRELKDTTTELKQEKSQLNDSTAAAGLSEKSFSIKVRLENKFSSLLKHYDITVTSNRENKELESESLNDKPRRKAKSALGLNEAAKAAKAAKSEKVAAAAKVAEEFKSDLDHSPNPAPAQFTPPDLHTLKSILNDDILKSTAQIHKNLDQEQNNVSSTKNNANSDIESQLQKKKLKKIKVFRSKRDVPVPKINDSVRSVKNSDMMHIKHAPDSLASLNFKVKKMYEKTVSTDTTIYNVPIKTINSKSRKKSESNGNKTNNYHELTNYMYHTHNRVYPPNYYQYYSNYSYH